MQGRKLLPMCLNSSVTYVSESYPGAPFLPTFLARQKSRSPPRRGGETAVEVEVKQLQL
ncbi:hypothetical protein RR42_m0664 [Cupriavidus basilensis]|uniref:Uncharacterized protein n=1 Tax=Cupriavidus basilensis TaxID=68895 RepID=A0A0C4YBV4_9BURK|nr:hypothetical protein RR42_m0664 [Cupriavidus basilensis]